MVNADKDNGWATTPQSDIVMKTLEFYAKANGYVLENWPRD